MKLIQSNQILLRLTAGEYDHIIAAQREFEGNLIFENNILNTLNEIKELLYCVNDIELFGEMIDLIYKFRFRLRELENQLKFLEDKKIQLSQNISYILEEMTKSLSTS